MSQFRNLIFEGGGVKGIAYVGALQVLEEHGILSDVVRVGGTSAGAINSVLLACDYTFNEKKTGCRDDDTLKIELDRKRPITEVGPLGRTGSCCGFDRLAGLFLLETVWAEVSQSRV